ncbi:bifunctional tetrahydrofolate synthase/dihydrofolate synthase [Buchnera aphidicola]|uniref:bifunctional tetrahydrofolate synthase/dihydrofolate synthase n=1 Tax=Buchnera aphidicola TaxID=9 RepID=UPI003BEF2BDC
MDIKHNALLTWLEYLKKFNKNITLNLTNVYLIAKRLNLLSMNAFIFTVAGTNGKGTTCAMLEKIFLNSGYRVGLYTSPHIVSYLERVKINGNILEEQYHVFSFLQIEKARGSIILSFFEFITLSALFLFKHYLLDIIILEVGLGGRLDATNIIDSNISIITNIGIDHISLLGADRESIAREKSGIFRSGRIAIIGDSNIPNCINKIAKSNKVILKKNNIDWYWTHNHNNSWNFFHEYINIYNLDIPKIPISSVSVALSAVYYSGLQVNINTIRKSISTIYLIGRFHTISYFPQIILDVAHNADAALYLSKKIRKMNIHGKIYAIIGILNDKDIRNIILPLKHTINYWYAAPLKTNRTATIYQLKKYLFTDNTFFLKNIHKAWIEVKKRLHPEDLVIVFGSFITVSEFIIAKKIDG